MFSAAIRCGLIEALDAVIYGWQSRPFSAAIRCGLIEAEVCHKNCTLHQQGFPQRFAAASLKLTPPGTPEAYYWRFSAAIRCGLIEASIVAIGITGDGRFSAAIRCGLIEAKHNRP